jgi:hypothetical protein
MPEMPYAGKDHGKPEPVGSFDDLLIADGSSRLNNRRSASFCDFLNTVRERKKGVGRGDGSIERQHSFHCSDAAGIDTAHLPRAYTYTLAIAGVENRIRLDVLANLPRKEQSSLLLWRGGALGNDLQVGLL